MKALKPIKDPRKPPLAIESDFNDGDYATLMARKHAALPAFPVFSIADFPFSNQMKEMGLQDYSTTELHEQAQKDFPGIGKDSTAMLLYKGLKITRFFAAGVTGKGRNQSINLAIFPEGDSNSFYKVDISADRVQAMLENELRLNAQQITGRPQKPVTRIHNRKVDATPYPMAKEMRNALVIARDNFEELTGRTLFDELRAQKEIYEQTTGEYLTTIVPGNHTITLASPENISISTTRLILN